MGKRINFFLLDRMKSMDDDDRGRTTAIIYICTGEGRKGKVIGLLTVCK